MQGAKHCLVKKDSAKQSTKLNSSEERSQTVGWKPRGYTKIKAMMRTRRLWRDSTDTIYGLYVIDT